MAEPMAKMALSFAIGASFMISAECKAQDTKGIAADVALIHDQFQDI
jgi:hypothetical protein